MTSAEADVTATITSFLHRVGKYVDFDPGTRLYAGGIGLDSLETAELSAVLEDTHGTDPFQSGPMPQTVGDILGFYDTAAASA